MSVASEITRLQGAKASLKTSIENKGVTVPAATKIDGYAALVDQIQAGGDTDGLNGFLSVESKTIQTSASATTNITYNKNCGILDENYKKWDTLAWHQRWVDNGYSATGLSKPIGIWMKAFGLDVTFLWGFSDSYGYSDVSGTISPTTSTFTMLYYNINKILSATSTDRTVWPANVSGNISHGTAGKYKSATWRSANNGDGLDMECDNTRETFTIPSRSVGVANAFMKDNNDDYIESYYQQCEFMRALFAICSGVACPTGTADGTKTTVEILNSNGQQAAVGEDMYFWIGGSNTNLLAKYNLNSNPSTTGNTSSGLLTQAIADGIYAKQKQNGVNMNDTGVNSASKPTLLSGMKGAEAIAVDGYWYIKTPYISAPNGTIFSSSTNIVDAPFIYCCKKNNISVPTERMLYVYWLNRSTHITSLINLITSVEGFISGSFVTNSQCWSPITASSTNLWNVHLGNGIIANSFLSARMAILPCLPSSTTFTT